MKYDIAIAGCGIAGAVAGLAALKEDKNVCIVEKNERESIGKKICGELMTQKALKFLKREFGISIKGYPLKGLEFVSSSGHASRAPEPLCTVNRHQLGQALLSKVLDNGAEIVHTTVIGPVGESCVTGVKTKDSAIDSSITIDCSGVAACVRRKLMWEPELLGIAYKENLILKEPFHKEYAMLIFDKNVIPSGYLWCFPKSEYEVNVGAGGLVSGKAFLKEKVETLKKTLKITIKRKEFPGFGVVPLGRPLPSLVYPGLLVCGDAASQVNPLTGEGIAPAVTAGFCAGKVAAQAVENSNTSVKGLWKYNNDFAREYGVAHAPLIAARNFLVSLSDEELNYFLENIVTGDDLGQLIKGKFHYTQMRKMKIFFCNWRKLQFLFRLYAVSKRMNEIRTLYNHYPQEPEEFSSWKHALDHAMNF